MITTIHRALLVALILLCLAAPYRVAAQDGTGNTPGGVTIHVVQRGETLFHIAMLYGTTVEAISEANGITDPQYITVGQRLLIPGAQSNTPGALVTVIIHPGETLETIVRSYHTTVESVSASNFITSPRQLYVGEELTISQGSANSSLVAPGLLVHALPGENWFRLALRYEVTLDSLFQANNLTFAVPLFTGERLWIPVTSDSTPVDLAPPFEACIINPIPAVQGETVSLHLTTTEPVTLAGTFMGYPLNIATENNTEYYTLFGVHAFTVGGIYPIELVATRSDGSQAALTLRLRVDDGGYGTETITLASDQQELLTPEVNEPEWERIATTMSGFTAQRYFDGPMGLPSSGAITSEFGTRRDYNDGALDTFHSGTDFGGGPGSPIVAPAAGVVVLAENLPVRGNATIIDHGWGVYTGYWHQSEIDVTVGQIVAPGQIIGLVGSTGRATGPHLHWEMWVGGNQVDPMQWAWQSFP